MGHAQKVIHYDFQSKTKIKGEKTNRVKKVGEGLIRSANISDVDALRIKMTTATSEEDLRARIILEFLCRFGMRASELCLLKKSDFVQDADGNHLLRYYRPKRKDFHTVKITKRAKDELLAMIEAYHLAGKIEKLQKKDHILFSTRHPWSKIRTELTTRSLQRIVNGFGLTDGRGKLLAPHGLRHYAGIRMVKERDHIAGSKLLGNSAETFSQYYSDPSTEALD